MEVHFSLNEKRIGQTNENCNLWYEMQEGVLNRIPHHAILNFYYQIESKYISQLVRERDVNIELRELTRKSKKK